MKHIPIALLLCLTSLSLTQCNSRNNVTIVSHASDGLDLKAVTELALKSKNAEDFEKALNTPSNKVNNLDLDENNEIDFIKVTEIYQDNMKGFSLTVELPDEQEQEVCTIQFEKDRAQTHGNRHMYGNNHYYRRNSIGSSLLMGYIFSRHTPYHSSYGRGNYPSNFSSSPPIPKSQYSGFHGSQPYASSYQKASSNHMSTELKSPNANKVASNIKAPLKNPSTSQKSFQKSNPSKSVRSSSSSRFGSSSSSRSGSSFGGGK